MDEQTKNLLRRGIAGLSWAASRLTEVERTQGPSPDLLGMQRDCMSLLERLAPELENGRDPDVVWHPKWPIILSGQDLTFLASLFRFLGQDSKGGGGHLRSLLELERFISQVEWV
jgi:hypothetical protein